MVGVEDAVERVGQGVDYVLEGTGLEWTTRFTTILDLTGDPTVFREGDVARDELATVTGAFDA